MFSDSTFREKKRDSLFKEKKVKEKNPRTPKERNAFPDKMVNISQVQNIFFCALPQLILLRLTNEQILTMPNGFESGAVSRKQTGMITNASVC